MIANVPGCPNGLGSDSDELQPALREAPVKIANSRRNICAALLSLVAALPAVPIGNRSACECSCHHMSSSSATSWQEAVIKLKQGFGRLIGRKGDTGQVAILDPRIRSKPYGRQFLDSLPDCTLVIDDGDAQ